MLDLDDVEEALIEHPDGIDNNEECSFVVKAAQRCKDNEETQNGDSNSDDNEEHGFPAYACDIIMNDCINESEFSDELRVVYQTYISKSICPLSYHFRASSVAERDHWINDINSAIQAHRHMKADSALQAQSMLNQIQCRAREAYFSVPFQMGTALLVALNFFFTVHFPRNLIISPFKKRTGRRSSAARDSVECTLP